MKIYEIGTGYTPIPAQIGAATEIVVEDLTRSFIRHKYDVEIIDISAENRVDSDLPIVEVKVPSVFTKKDVSLGIMHKLKRVVYSLALTRKLKKILKNANEKVVLHFHNQYNLFFFLKLASKKLRNKAIVGYTVHSYVWNEAWDKIEDTVNKRYFQEIYCVKNADAVFVLNDVTKEHFVNRLQVNGEKIYKVLNGVNVERYSSLGDVEIANLKNEHGLNGKKMLFQVGSVCERKNQLGTVKMLSDYLKNHRDVVYMYAGGVIDAEYKQKIDDFSKENGISEQVLYVGELSPGAQLNKYYNMASCSVFTSARESFGLVIIEAIITGTPVVLAGNLTFDSNDGSRVYNNPEEFVSLVDSIVNGDIGWFDCKSIREKYNWDTVSKTYTDMFERIYKNS